MNVSMNILFLAKLIQLSLIFSFLNLNYSFNKITYMLKSDISFGYDRFIKHIIDFVNLYYSHEGLPN